VNERVAESLLQRTTGGGFKISQPLGGNPGCSGIGGHHGTISNHRMRLNSGSSHLEPWLRIRKKPPHSHSDGGRQAGTPGEILTWRPG
jgi:hypothetical protein